MQIYNDTEAGYWTGAIHVTLRYERIRTQAQYGRIVVVSIGLAQLTDMSGISYYVNLCSILK